MAAMKQTTDYLPTCHEFAKSKSRPKRSSKAKPVPACKCGQRIISTTGNCWACDNATAEARMAAALRFIQQAKQMKAAAPPPLSWGSKLKSTRSGHR